MTEQAEVLSAGDARARVAVLEEALATPTPEYVWVRLLDNMVADNGGPYLSSTADFDEARPAIAALIEAGFFRGDPSDLDSDFWQAVGGEVDEANERFASQAEHYRVLDDVLHRVFENPADFPAPVERCDTCYGHGEVPTGETQRFGDLQPPEPIMMACPECDGGAPVERVEVIPRPVIDWAETGALDYRDSWSTRINGHTVGLHSDEERARNHAWALEAYLGMHKIIAAHQHPAPTAAQDVAEQPVMNWRNCYHRASMDLCAIGELLGVPEEDQCTPEIIEAIKALQQSNPPEQVEPVAWMHDSPGRVDVISAEVKKLLVDSHDTAGHLHRPLDKSEHYTIPLYTAPAMNEHEEMKNAMQLAQGPKPTTLGQLHDYLDSIRKAWSAQDTKYLGSYESQPLYILPNDPTPGFQLAEAKYFAEFGLTFIPVEGASK